MIIAIDGLAANGKTTLAKMLAKKLNIEYLSTGNIYRCMALEIINKDLDINNLCSVIECLKNIKINFKNDEVYLNDKNVTTDIRTDEISLKSTTYGMLEEIKELVRKIQKEYIQKDNIVIEGRDICTRIAPNADFKFYLYANFETRLERFWKDNKMLTLAKAREVLTQIDDEDIRVNFIKPVNAIEIDTTNKTLEEVFEIMMTYIERYIK